MVAKGKSVRVSKPSKTEGKPTSTIDWPPLGARPAYEDQLTIQSLYPDHIITIPNLWSRRLCKEYVEFLSRLPLVTTPATQKKDHAVRVNDRFQIDDPIFARTIWETGLKQTLSEAGIDDKAYDSEKRQQLLGGEVLGLNSNIRVYRYRAGQFFASHCWSRIYDLYLFTDNL